MEPVDFGSYLKKIRKAKKLTVRQLDLYSGVSHSYISQMESGARGIPKPEILKKLSKPLGVEYEELMKMAGYIEESKEDKQAAANQLIEFIELDLTNEEIISRMDFKLKVDDMTLSDDELSEFISYIRWQRSKRKKQQTPSDVEEPSHGRD